MTLNTCLVTPSNDEALAVGRARFAFWYSAYLALSQITERFLELTSSVLSICFWRIRSADERQCGPITSLFMII